MKNVSFGAKLIKYFGCILLYSKKESKFQCLLHSVKDVAAAICYILFRLRYNYES
jgi:hypothetical protein